MAKKILTPYDFSQNEIQNAVAQVLASAPSTPKAGQFYYNSTSGRFIYRGAAAWIDPTDRANHSGTQLAATISDLTTAITAVRLDQHAAPTAAVSLNSQKITNLADGTTISDAATWGQVQNLVNGLDWKQSVRAATTANITLSGLQTIDGITLVANDRVLVKNQTTASANGIYLAASGAWTRTTDADGALELTPATTVMVEEGTTLADTQWRITTDGAITIGTTSITWVQIGAATSYTGGTGISIVGSTISADTTVLARKAAAFLGDNATTTFNFLHNLNTTDVVVSLKEVATSMLVDADITVTTANQIAITFASYVPPVNGIRVLVVG